MQVLERGQKLALDSDLLKSPFNVNFTAPNSETACILFSSEKFNECVTDNSSSCGGIKDISNNKKSYLVNLSMIAHDIDEVIFYTFSDKLDGLFSVDIPDHYIVQNKFEGQKIFQSIRLYKHNGNWKINYKAESSNDTFESYLLSNYNYRLEKINKIADTSDIKNKLIELAQKIIKTKDSVQSEEATKTAYILPFLQILDYDIFNPVEVEPEPVADIGVKKGEKVDYAINLNGQQVMIIECKSLRENLDIHKSQLHRYFNVSTAKIACLTNGINYRFYTDIDEINKMDFEPFLEFNILDISESEIKNLSIVSKKNFDLNNVIKFANRVKNSRESEYIEQIKTYIIQEFESPSPDFVKFLLSNFYDKEKVTSKTIEYFTGVVKRALDDLQD